MRSARTCSTAFRSVVLTVHLKSWNLFKDEEIKKVTQGKKVTAENVPQVKGIEILFHR